MRDSLKTVSLVLNLLLAVLLVVSVWWIFKKNNRSNGISSPQQDIQQAIWYQVELSTELSAVDYMSDRLLGLHFPRLEMTDIEGKTISTDLIKTKKKGAFVLVFKPSSCQPCLNTQLKILNHIYNLFDHGEQFPIIAITPGNQLYEIKRMALKYKIKFPFVVDLGHQFFNPDNSSLFEYTPIVFLINNNNTIVQSHIPLYNRPIYSAIFFNETQRFLPLKAPLFDSYLDNIDLIDLFKGNFSTKPIDHLLY